MGGGVGPKGQHSWLLHYLVSWGGTVLAGSECPRTGPLYPGLLGLGRKEDVVAWIPCSIVTGIPVPTQGLSSVRLPRIHTDQLHAAVPISLLTLLLLSTRPSSAGEGPCIQSWGRDVRGRQQTDMPRAPVGVGLPPRENHGLPRLSRADPCTTHCTCVHPILGLSRSPCSQKESASWVVLARSEPTCSQRVGRAPQVQGRSAGHAGDFREGFYRPKLSLPTHILKP